MIWTSKWYKRLLLAGLWSRFVTPSRVHMCLSISFSHHFLLFFCLMLPAKEQREMCWHFRHNFSPLTLPFRFSHFSFNQMTNRRLLFCSPSLWLSNDDLTFAKKGNQFKPVMSQTTSGQRYHCREEVISQSGFQVIHTMNLCRRWFRLTSEWRTDTRHSDNWMKRFGERKQLLHCESKSRETWISLSINHDTGMISKPNDPHNCYPKGSYREEDLSLCVVKPAAKPFAWLSSLLLPYTSTMNRTHRFTRRLDACVYVCGYQVFPVLPLQHTRSINCGNLSKEG